MAIIVAVVLVVLIIIIIVVFAAPSPEQNYVDCRLPYNYKGVQPPLMTMTPKGPIIIVLTLLLLLFAMITIKIIIIGPFGVIVIRGGWTPLSISPLCIIFCDIFKLQQGASLDHCVRPSVLQKKSNNHKFKIYS